jgi:phosphoribosylglycinamide formyltransferase-1
VHYVTAQLDGGPVVLQSRLAVAPQDDENSLSARIQAGEHIIYPRVIGWIASGRLRWQDGRPMMDGQPLAQPMIERADRGRDT